MAQVNDQLGQSIIAAFAQARQQALAEKQLQTQQEQFKEQEALREKEHADAQKALEFEHQKQQEQLDYQRNIAEANLSLQQSQQRNALTEGFKKQVESTGVRPEQYNENTNLATAPRVEVAPGQFAVQHSYIPKDTNSNLEPFTALHPVDRAVLQNTIDTEATKAKTANAIEVKQAEDKRLAAKDALERQDKIGQLNNQLKIAREGNAKDLEVARIRIQAGQSGNLSGLAQAVIANPEILNDPSRVTPTQRGKVLNELGNQGISLPTYRQENTLELVNGAIDNVSGIKSAKEFNTGLIAKAKSHIPGTQEYANGIILNQLKSQLTVPELKNVVGLGRLTTNEFNALTAAATKLDLGLPKDEFNKELDLVEKLLNKSKSDIESKSQNFTPKVEKGNTNTKVDIPAYLAPGAKVIEYDENGKRK